MGNFLVAVVTSYLHSYVHLLKKFLTTMDISFAALVTQHSEPEFAVSEPPSADGESWIEVCRVMTSRWHRKLHLQYTKLYY